jgi:hypothetical protein
MVRPCLSGLIQQGAIALGQVLFRQDDAGKYRSGQYQQGKTPVKILKLHDLRFLVTVGTEEFIDIKAANEYENYDGRNGHRLPVDF